MAEDQVTEKKPIKHSRGGGGGQGGGRGGFGGSSDGQGGNAGEKQKVGERSELNSDRGRGNSGRGRYDRGGGGGERGGGGGERGGYSDRGRGRGGRRGRGGGQRNYGGGGGGYSHEMRDHQRQKQPRTDIRSGPKTDDQLFEGNISSGINFTKYENIPVTIDGNSPPKPVTSFADSGLHSIILKNVERCGYTSLTPVQKYSIPIVLGNRDLMACAQTGSGKTAAFLMPAIHQFLSSGLKSSVGKCQSPQCLVITPTRELAIQIYDEARKFAFSSGLRAALAYGGVSTGSQASSMAEGCNFLVATPGRLIDFMQQGKVSFEQVKYLVLDEGDKMMDMGFIPDIKRIVNHPSMSKKESRQTLMFSATFPPSIKKVANEFLHNFLFLSVGVVGGACTDVEQIFYQVAKRDKKNKLSEVLKNTGAGKTLVFIRTKHKTQRLAQQLSREGFPATSIHGDRTQPQRELALAEFREGTKDILMATDVVARGLDIKDVTHVINYDMPRDIEEYVHRIGRTGRVGNCGRATSFYDGEEDGAIVNDLVKILSQCDQKVPDWLAALVGVVPVKKKKHKNKGGVGQNAKEDNHEKVGEEEVSISGAVQGENRKQRNGDGKGNRADVKVEDGQEKHKGDGKKDAFDKEGSSESRNSRKRRNRGKKAVKDNDGSVDGQLGDQPVKDENSKIGTKKKTSKESYTHEHDTRVEDVEYNKDDQIEKNSRGKDRRQNQGRKDFTEEEQKRNPESKVRTTEENSARKNSQPVQENPADESRSAHRNNHHDNSRGRRNHDHRGSGRSQQGSGSNPPNHDHDRHQQGNKQNRVHDDRHSDQRQNRVPDERGFDQKQNRVPEPAGEMNEKFVKARTPESNTKKFEDPRGGAGKYAGGHQEYQNGGGGRQDHRNNQTRYQEFQNNGAGRQDYQNGGHPEFQNNGTERQEYQNYGRGRQDFHSHDYRANQSSNGVRENQNYESRGRNHNSSDHGGAAGYQDYQEEAPNTNFGSSDIRYRDNDGGRGGRGRPSSRGGRPTGRRLNNAAADIVGILNQQARGGRGEDNRGGRGEDHRGGRGEENRGGRGEDYRSGREGSFENRQNNSGPSNDNRSNDARNNPGPTSSYRDSRRYGGPPSPPAINQEVADYASLMELQARLAQERADRSASRNTERNRPSTRDLANTSNWPSLEASLEGGR